MDSIKFLGATVVDVEMSLGFGSETSEVTVNLVEDLRNGDSFTSGVVGSPYRLTVGSMVFDGILQQQENVRSPRGFTHSVRLRSPNDFLDGLSLIISDYNGEIGGAPNLMNLYGYWEDQFGFGGALTNDLGMVWEAENISITMTTGNVTSSTSNGMYGIKPGIEALQSAGSVYGEAFTYNGIDYHFDFSQITGIDPNWRFSADGGSARLMDVIDSVCNDKGFDYTVSLHMDGSGPHTVRINTVDRATPPQLGKISEFISSASGAMTLNVGQELNFQQTSLFLVGANIESIFQQTNASKITPFWGFMPDGSLIEGSGFDDAYTVTVPCPEIADIIGTSTYTFTVAELRCALSNQDIWGGYVAKYKAALATQLALASCFSTDDESFTDYRFSHDFIMQNPQAALTMGLMNENNQWTSVIGRVFSFVRNYAANWYGKRFVVKTPVQLQFKFEPDTEKLKWDWEPIDSAYLENGANPLGLNAFNQQFFETPEDKFQGIVKFTFDNLATGPTGADITSYQNPYKLVQNNQFYTTCRVIDNSIFFAGAETAVAIELEDTLFTVPVDTLGGVEDINTLFSISSREWADWRNSTSAGKYHPAALQPSSVGLPFRSNTESYGPWQIAGDPAKTEYRKEESLAPWNYGGYIYMNAAASGILENFVRNSQVNEEGIITVPGLPTKSLGESIEAYGANITNINITLSSQGVTTTYVMRTHTQKPGAFGKLRMERLSLLGQRHARLGRKILEIGRKTNGTIKDKITSHSSYKWLEGHSRAIRQESPHGTMVGFQVARPSYATGATSALVSSQTYEESVANVSQTGAFIQAACVSMDGLFRPFSIDTNYPGVMPKQELRANNIGDCIDRGKLDYFGGGVVDVDWYAFGNEYQGIHAGKVESNPAQARILGQRMPFYGVGWGYDYYGKPTPNASGEVQAQFKGSFIDNHRLKSDQWKAGPVALHWDQKRKVWTIPTSLKGVADGDIEPGVEGWMAVYTNGAVKEDRIRIFNYFDTKITSGTKTIALYDQWENRYDVIAAPCSPSDLSIPPVTPNASYDGGTGLV